MRPRIVGLLLALVVLVPVTGCTTKEQCTADGGTWVQTWTPYDHYNRKARRWVGGWHSVCRKDHRP